MKKILYGLMTFALTSMNAVGFGSAGYHSGTGVANKENVYSQYYNPALTALSRARVSVGLNAQMSLNGSHLKDNLQNAMGSADLLKLNGNLAIGFNTTIGALFTGLNLKSNLHLGNKIINGQDVLYGGAFTLFEIPVSYAYALDFRQFGRLSIGVTGKYLMGSMKYVGSDSATIDDIDGFDFINPFKLGEKKNNFTFDLGAAYNIGMLTVGIVGKNLTSPTFDYEMTKITLDPQLRAGVALDWGIIHASIDADLLENQNAFNANIKERIVAFGVGLGGEWIRGDFGIETNVANNNDLFYLIGLRLGIFDFNTRFSNKGIKINGYKIPLDWEFSSGLSFRF